MTTLFDDIYLIEAEFDLQAEDAKQVKWASEAEILTVLVARIFIPYYQDVISLLFKMRHRRGVIKGD